LTVAEATGAGNASGAEETMKDNGHPARRGFLTRTLALVCGGLATLVPVGAGVWTFLDPLRRGGGAGGGRFIPVADLSAIPADGLPRRFAVIADRKDAWTGYEAEPIGAVWLGERLADVLGPGTHATTYGGTALACAVALEVLKIIDEEGLAKNIERMGEELKKGLGKFQKFWIY
jgi:hypothetical protein